MRDTVLYGWVWLDATEGLGASYRRKDAPLSTRGTAVGLRLIAS